MRIGELSCNSEGGQSENGTYARPYRTVKYRICASSPMSQCTRVMLPHMLSFLVQVLTVYKRNKIEIVLRKSERKNTEAQWRKVEQKGRFDVL